MAVPISGNFEMFGTGSSNSIAGAISSSGVDVSGITTFNDLIAVSTVEYFDPIYAGSIASLNEVLE
jgi:hypothetical protein